ncbi:MAG: alcohol dehydrogenase [Devosia sp. 67-54]|uniref:Zn-dependent alcohol dehydrogenase n=1 Tax=unclassified Devosia TaxID=196773 RepID=UPI0009591F7E|nr:MULTISPECIES: Zn-dependent alcohol dehydrogenase [unclassified Devosia]MBN9305461.1 Zn-dependent alcohol dehydrogenase [Devosia sp.]OJX19048.1 MAG: alcohol dehydrogenase [Devosia sp. 67-54]
MKAAVVWKAGEPITLENVTIEKPKSREVLVRTAYAGICHSDLHFADGTYPHPVPYVPGHEAAGIVEAVGEDVIYVKPGDHVVGCLSVFCGTCPQCVTGHPNLCESDTVKLAPGVARRMSLNGEVVYQSSNISAFAEQMLVHENAIVKIDRDLPLDRAALVSCGVLTGVGAVIHSAKIEPGSTVAVIGCGGVGLSVISGAVIAGAGRIIAIDRLDSKLALATELGATDVINATDKDPVGDVVEMTKGGVNYAFEALGLKQTADQAFRMLRMGGTATLIGMFKPGQKLEFEGSMFIKDRKIQGSSMGSNQFRVDIPNLMNYYRQGRLKLDHLISDKIELDQINQGFANLRSGVAVRQLFDFHAEVSA